MPTQRKPDTLEIRLNDSIVGTLTRLIDETLVLAFDPGYQNNSQRPILSLSYKGPANTLHVARSRTGTRLSPFFSNLLPEGHLRDYLARKLGMNSSREFFLLAGLGLDLPGAVIVRPLGELSNEPMDNEPSAKSNHSVLRFSLAGVQLKFSAVAETKGTFTIPAGGAGGSWIVKLPSEKHLQIPEVEYSMLRLAQLTGIAVPDFKLIPTSSIEGLPQEFKSSVADSLAVQRFDRTINGGRIHMEDFAQVYDVYPQNKYEKAGYGHIGRVLWAEDGEKSYLEFIRRLVFTVAIGNGDMHLKNWSLLYSDPVQPVLSPAYDFVPTVAYIEGDNLALNLAGTKDFYAVDLDKFVKLARQSQASERITKIAVQEFVSHFSDIWKDNRFDLRLPADVRQVMANHLNKLALFKDAGLVQGADFAKRPWTKNIAIASVEYDPIIQSGLMILEASTGHTTSVHAPKKMEPELILEAAREAHLLQLGEGHCRAFVGEKLYRQWRRNAFITIDSHPRRFKMQDFKPWRGEIETLEGKYSSDSWQKITSAYQRQSMEQFDIIQKDNSIRTVIARIQSIREIAREANEDSTRAAIELLIEDQHLLLNPHEGISTLSSSFERRELQDAVEEMLKADKWENSVFSDPRRLRARKSSRIDVGGKKTQVPLELEILFEEDVRKTSLIIKLMDVEAKLAKQINWQAREIRQRILDFLPGPD